MSSTKYTSSSGAFHPDLRDDLLARKADQLEAAVRRWLGQAGSEGPIAIAWDSTLRSLLEVWISNRPSDGRLDHLPALAMELGKSSTGQSPRGPESLVAAFARTVVARAMGEVSREASQAGHHESFEALRHFLDSEPDVDQMAELKRTLNLTEGAISVALSRLRRRLQQRIEAALAVWSGPGVERNELRRKLRESLTGTESWK